MSKIIKCQFKGKDGEYKGRLYSYATDMEDVKDGDLVVIEDPNGDKILKVADANVSEEETQEAVIKFGDKLKYINKKYEPTEAEDEHHEN